MHERETAMLRWTFGLFINLVVVVVVYAQDSGTFTGRVISSDGNPIESATVTLPDFGDGQLLAVSKTDHQGNFELSVRQREGSPIHRNSSGLQVDAEGYAATYMDHRHLTLFPGRSKDLGDIVLDVGHAYVGRVTDQTGHPIRESTVRCGAYRNLLGRTVIRIGREMLVTTDSDGQFQTPRIPLGVPYLYVEAEGYVTGSYDPHQFADARGDGPLALPELSLTPDKPIHGTVENEQGEPIKRATVRTGLASVTTDEHGTFVLRGFGDDAEFQLQIPVEGYAFVNWGVSVTPDGFEYYDVTRMDEIDRRDAESYRKSLAAITTKTPALEIVMQREARIHGRVVDVGTGEPVTLSEIVLCTFTRKKDGEIVLDGCRAPGFDQPKPGEFSIGYTYPTEYHIAVSAEGYEDGEAFTPLVTTLQDIDGIVVQMTRKGTSTDATPMLRQTIVGTVKDEDRLLEGARVALWAVPGKNNAENAYIIRGRTTIGDGYVFKSEILKDGQFSLDVPYQSGDWYVLVETPSRVVSLHGPVAVGRGETKYIEVVPRAGGGLRGLVTNHSSVALPLYAILFSDVGLQYETRVKADGSFEFADVFPGTYGLKVGCDSIPDTEVPDFSDENMTFESQFEVSVQQSQPWSRAKRVIVNQGQVLKGIEVDFGA
jgi:hypothetical protein